MGTFFFNKTLQSKKRKQGDDLRGESAKMSAITPHLTGKLFQEGHLCRRYLQILMDVWVLLFLFASADPGFICHDVDDHTYENLSLVKPQKKNLGAL